MEMAITLLPHEPLPLSRHPGESRGPGASGRQPNMWPLESGFRRNDDRGVATPGPPLVKSVAVRRLEVPGP